jgi:flagellar operon protein
MIIKNNNLISQKINGINSLPKQIDSSPKVKELNQDNTNQNFDKILNDKIKSTSEDIRFSKHAELRLKSRNIELSDMQKQKLNQAVDKAKSKGVKDSLVLMDNIAFVISIKNKMVVTAMNGNEMKDNVFTNIDGAVIM